MPPRPVLLLDVMGTLVHDPFFVEVPAFFGMTLEQLLAVKHPTAWVEFELGRIDEEAFFPRFFLDGRAYDHQGLKRAMRDAYAWLDGMEELLRDLSRAGTAMHALSNYAPWYSLIEQKVGLSRYVRWTFVSCDTGYRKPDPAAYRHALDSLGVAPAQCVFVDDRGSNCKPAAAMGMHAIRFEGAASLRAALAACGAL